MKPKAKAVSGQSIIKWIEVHCYVPEGPLIGQRIKLLPFQRRIVASIYDTPTRTAIVSLPKKNGKTSLVGCLTLAKMCGPEALRNAQLFSTAQSRDQASVLFDLMTKMVRLSPTLSAVIDVQETRRALLVPELGNRYRALSADHETAHGLSPSFVVHDELGVVRGPKFELYQTLERSFGAQANPLTVIISTQAAQASDLMSLLIDDALRGEDPRTKLFLFSAPIDADPFVEQTWKLANPAYGVFLNKAEVSAQADMAQRLPSEEPSFRNYVLNQRVEAQAAFVSPAIWAANGAQPTPLDGLEVDGGLDLSAVNDLTGLVLVADDGSVHSFAWLPAEGLAEKAKRDRTDYLQWVKDGHLISTPGRAVDYMHVANQLRGIFNRCKVRSVQFDPVFMRFLQPRLVDAGFTEAEIARFVPFRQGFISMGPAIRELEVKLERAELKHGNNPVLAMCAANATVVQDHAGNKKFSKLRAHGRIDLMICLTMAVAAPKPDAKPEPDYRVFILG